MSESDGGSKHLIPTHNCLACSSWKSCQKVNVIHYVFQTQAFNTNGLSSNTWPSRSHVRQTCIGAVALNCALWLYGNSSSTRARSQGRAIQKDIFFPCHVLGIIIKAVCDHELKPMPHNAYVSYSKWRSRQRRWQQNPQPARVQLPSSKRPCGQPLPMHRHWLRSNAWKMPFAPARCPPSPSPHL